YLLVVKSGRSLDEREGRESTARVATARRVASTYAGSNVICQWVKGIGSSPAARCAWARRLSFACCEGPPIRVHPMNVRVLAAGGTIAMSGAGGAKLALDASDLVASVPGLAGETGI